MELLPWPATFFDRKSGSGCPQCAEGRPAMTADGIRFHAGAVSDSYLQRRGPTAGYSVVVFRGRHVSEPDSMSPAETAAFWVDVTVAARAIRAVFTPVHLNFQILGNADPHVHVHIVPRYDPDPAPGMPLPPDAWSKAEDIAAADLTAQIELLSAAATQG